MIVLKVSTEKVLTMNLKYEEKEQKVNRIFSLVNNLLYFLNEYIQQQELVDEIFLLLLLHLNAFHVEVNLEEKTTIHFILF